MDVIAQHRKALTAAVLAAVGLANAYLGIDISTPLWLVDIGHLGGLDLTVSGIVNILILMLFPVAVHQVPNEPTPEVVAKVEQQVLDRAGNPNAGGG